MLIAHVDFHNINPASNADGKETVRKLLELVGEEVESWHAYLYLLFENYNVLILLREDECDEENENYILNNLLTDEEKATIKGSLFVQNSSFLGETAFFFSSYYCESPIEGCQNPKTKEIDFYDTNLDDSLYIEPYDVTRYICFSKRQQGAKVLQERFAKIFSLKKKKATLWTSTNQTYGFGLAAHLSPEEIKETYGFRVKTDYMVEIFSDGTIVIGTYLLPQNDNEAEEFLEHCLEQTTNFDDLFFIDKKRSMRGTYYPYIYYCDASVIDGIMLGQRIGKRIDDVLSALCRTNVLSKIELLEEYANELAKPYKRRSKMYFF